MIDDAAGIAEDAAGHWQKRETPLSRGNKSDVGVKKSVFTVSSITGD
jgi:hypothetical protein